MENLPFEPSEDQIADACREIRSAWDEREAARRFAYPLCDGWEVPQVERFVVHEDKTEEY